MSPTSDLLVVSTTNRISVSSDPCCMFGPEVASSPSASAGLDSAQGSRGSAACCDSAVAPGFDGAFVDCRCDGCGYYKARVAALCSGFCGRSRLRRWKTE